MRLETINHGGWVEKRHHPGILYIDRNEADFDRACDWALERARAKYGIDDAGHSSWVEIWDRTDSSIKLEFTGLTWDGQWEYRFKCWIVKIEE